AEVPSGASLVVCRAEQRAEAAALGLPVLAFASAGLPEGEARPLLGWGEGTLWRQEAHAQALRTGCAAVKASPDPPGCPVFPHGKVCPSCYNGLSIPVAPGRESEIVNRENRRHHRTMHDARCT